MQSIAYQKNPIMCSSRLGPNARQVTHPRSLDSFESSNRTILGRTRLQSEGYCGKGRVYTLDPIYYGTSPPREGLPLCGGCKFWGFATLKKRRVKEGGGKGRGGGFTPAAKLVRLLLGQLIYTEVGGLLIHRRVWAA